MENTLRVWARSYQILQIKQRILVFVFSESDRKQGKGVIRFAFIKEGHLYNRADRSHSWQMQEAELEVGL